jgi:peptidoglycan/LPS O-acetylase OafA/YrhL
LTSDNVTSAVVEPQTIQKTTAGGATSQKVPWLNVMRGLSSVWIVYYHLFTPYATGRNGRLPKLDGNFIPASVSRHSEAGFGPWLSGAGALHDFIATMSLHAVGVFIFMSGFGVTASLLRRRDRGDLSWGSWFWQRFLRLYPLLWFAHLVYLFAPFVWRVEPTDYRFFLSLTGVRIWPMDMIIFYANPSWWFFWLIIQLYLVLPVLLFLLRRCGVVVFVLATVALSLAFRYWALFHEVSGLSGYLLIGGVFLSRLGEFALGVAVADLAHRHGAHILHALVTWKSTLIGLVLYALGWTCYTSSLTYVFVDLLATAGMVLITARIAVVVSKNSAMQAAFVFAGSVSLSTFLLHQPWTITFGLALHGQPAWVFALAALVAVPALVLIAWVCERFVYVIMEAIRKSRRHVPPTAETA